MDLNKSRKTLARKNTSILKTVPKGKSIVAKDGAQYSNMALNKQSYESETPIALKAKKRLLNKNNYK